MLGAASVNHTFLRLFILSFLLFTGGIGSTAAAAGTRVAADLIAEYTFHEGAGGTVTDVSGVSPALDLNIADTTKVEWQQCGGLTVTSNTRIQSGVPASKIIDAVKTSGAITVEAWIIPQSTSQSGPARIVTLSDGGYQRNVTLGQNGDKYQTRFRTSSTGSNGASPYTQTPAGYPMSLIEPTHVVYTRSAAGVAEMYLNGESVVTKTIDGDVSNWDDSMEFALANELGTDRHWLGQYFHVAVYGRDLAGSEVQQNYNAGIESGCGQVPTAAFTYEVIDHETLTVSFDGGESHVVDGTIVDYSWHFGDGATASGLTTTHTFSESGQYTVTLTVTDDQGATNFTSHTVAVTPEGRISKDQILYYNFTESQGDTIYDVSGVGTPADLIIPEPGKVSWLNCGGLSIDENTFISAVAAPTKLNDAVESSNEITIEAWVSPDNTTQSGPARIVTYSGSPSYRNFTFGQDQTNYNVRLRTTSTNNNGLYPHLAGSGNDVVTALSHVVYTRDALGTAKLYKDGQLIETTEVSSAMTNWNTGYTFGLANEVSGDRGWLGDIHLVAIYSRALISEEVEHNYLQGTGSTCGTNNTAPVITSTPPTTATVTAEYTHTVVATDAENDPLTYTLDMAPPGMVIDESAVIHWTPTAEQIGQHPVAVSVSDGQLSDQVSFSINVVSNNYAPILQPIADQEMQEAATLELALIATDADGDTLTYNAENLPDFANVSGSTLVFTPTYADAGNYGAITVSVSDGSATDSVSFSLDVLNTNQPPLFSSDPNTQVLEGELYQYLIQVQDPDNDPINVSLVTAPADMTLDGNTLNWQPLQADVGLHAIELQADDDQGGMATQSFTLIVNELDQSPEITSNPLTSVNDGDHYSYQVIATDGNQNDILTYSLTTFPVGMTITETGLIDWQPAYADVGNHNVSIQVVDQTGLNDTQSFVLVVSHINLAPQVTSSPSTIGSEGIDYQYAVVATDFEGDPLDYKLTNAPQGMTINETSGLVTWLPSYEQSGSHTVSVSVTDIHGAATSHTYSLTIADVNRAPIFSSGTSDTATALSPYQYQIAASDPDGDPISYQIQTLPSGVTFDNNTGMLEWTPSEAQIGQHLIQILVVDSFGAQTPIDLIIDVQALPNQVPTVVSSAPLTAIVDQDYSYRINAVDAEADILTYNVIDIPDFLTLTPDGHLIGKPAQPDIGTHSVTIGISDGQDTLEYQYQLKVIELPEAKLTNFGKDFWFVDPMYFKGYDDLKLTIYVTSINGASVHIDSPLNSNRAPVDVQVPANDVVAVDYYYSLGNNQLTHDQISTRAVHITSDEEIAVYVLFGKKYSTDAEVLIPTVSLGTEYRLLGYRAPQKGTATIHSYSFVATQDNTAVTITPNHDWQRASGEVIDANRPYDVILNRGEVYTLSSHSNSHLDLSGSTVSADKPIGAFITDRCVDVPWDSSYCDRLNEQLPPISKWGNRHALIPLFSRYIDMIRVMAGQDDTQIKVNGVITRVLQAGEFWQFDLTEAQFLESNKPVLVEHFSTSDNYDSNERFYNDEHHQITRRNSTNHAFENAIPNFKTEYLVNIDPASKNNSVILFVPEASRDSITVDGVAIPVEQFIFDPSCDSCTFGKYPDYPYAFAQVALTAGEHTISSDVAFGLFEGVHGLNSIADPFVSIVPPIDLAQRHYIFTTPTDRFGRHFINISLEKSALDSLYLDGVKVDPGFFSELSGTDQVYARLAINPGRHDLKANSPIGLHVYGFNIHDSYGFIGSFGEVSNEVVSDLSVNVNTLTPEIGDQLCMEAQVLSTSGLPLNDTPITVSLTGTHNITNNVFSEYNGYVEYCFTGYDLGQDVLTISAGDLEHTMDISWLPASQGGTKAPIITSSPTIMVNAGESYFYSVEAIDPENESLEFYLDAGPDGMIIHPNNGAIQWIATPGSHLVDVRVTDASGNSTNQTFNIETNSAPELTFYPKTFHRSVNHYKHGPYSSRIGVTDPEGDELFFERLEGAFSLNPNSGALSRSSYPIAPGDYPFLVRVWDEHGAYLDVDFVITVVDTVEPNLPPELVSSLPYQAKVGHELSHRLIFVDPEGASRSYAVTSTTPGAEISSSGVFSWTPTESGVFNVEVSASDGSNVTYISWDINVVSADQALAANLHLSPGRTVADGETITTTIAYSGAAAPANLQLWLDGEPIDVAEDQTASFVAEGIGPHTLEAVVNDGYDSAVVGETFYVSDPSDLVGPDVNIFSPGNGSEITSPTSVAGEVYDDNLFEWHLTIRPAGSDQAQSTTIASGNHNGEVQGELDPTLMNNGLYWLELSATDFGGLTRSVIHIVTIDGALKVGNLTFTQTDLEIPMLGLPIQINRTYDSRKRSEISDFGYGWSLGYQSVKVQESMEPTQGWYQVLHKALFSGSGHSFVATGTCTYPIGNKTVTVTLPNDEIEVFNVRARILSGGIESFSNPACSLSPGRYYELDFEAQNGSTATLEASGLTTLYLDDLDDGNLVTDLVNPTPVNVTTYVLTTKAGYRYDLNESFGIEKITDPNGNTLTFTYNGIEHSSGKSVTFERDSQGRIEYIYAPGGRTLQYHYDSSGDLSEFTDAVAFNTPEVDSVGYSYHEGHFLDEITDALDRRVLKNFFDSDGRLFKQENSTGVTKYFDHQIDDRTSTVTDLDGNTTIITYDDRGNVTEETKVMNDGIYQNIVTSYTYDANDNQETKTIGNSVWTTIYDSSNNLTYADDPEGNRVEYKDYNDRGQETKLIDELGRLTEMHYDSAGNLEQIDMPAVAGQLETLSASNVINARGLVESTTDLRGNITSYTYYGVGSPWQDQKHTESNPLTGTISYTYDENNNIKTEKRERTVDGVLINETVTYDYDERNRLTKTIYPDDSFTETLYDLAGNVDKERDRLGVWTDYTYDAYGRLVLTEYADGTTEERTYTNEGLLETVTDRMQRTTSYEYDDAGRLWKTTYHDGTYTETQYTPQGWVKYEWDENGNRTEYNYDLAGRRKEVIRLLDNQEIKHSYTYYDNGELHTETDALGNLTTYVINELDQRVETQFHNGTAIEQHYDGMGARTRQIDQNLIGTDYRYDDLGRLRQVQPDVYFDGERVPNTTYTYDEVGNKLTQTDANGHVTRWTYDYFGRVLTRKLPLGQVETFIYDDQNRTITHTDFNGDYSITQNDIMGRVESVSYFFADGTPRATESYTYYNNDQVHTVTDKNGVTEYGYDARDRLEWLIQPDGVRFDYGYDNVGNRTQVKVTRGSEITIVDYTYDDLNRLETVIDANGITTYTYYDNGNLYTVTYPNGVVTEYQYNTVNQLEVLTTKNAQDEIISQYTYGLDNTGRREDITELNGRFTDYEYDDLYRLIGETITDPERDDYSASYQYDWVGNRVYETVDGISTAYSYDDNDRLEQQGGIIFAYDDNGNTLTETLDGNVTEYFYDEKNKLTSVTKEGVTTDYTYNHNGIRTSKSESGVTTNFIVDENRNYAQVLQEIENDSVQVHYTYGHDLINQERTGVESYYLYDGLGSTRALTDSAGAITDTYFYEAFGEVLAESGDTENDYKFTGEAYDSSLDQIYLRNRFYDPGVGRFTTLDTYMGNKYDPVSLHKYLYANADPGNMIDPSGYFSIGSAMTAISVASTLVGAAQTSYTVFKVATGEEEFDAKALGTAVIFNMVGGAAGKLVGYLGKGIRKACNSFEGETLVATESGLVPISQIKIGDMVWSYDEETGEKSLQEVVHLIQSEGEKNLIDITLVSGEVLKATEGHPFYTTNSNEWINAGDLTDRHVLFGLVGDPLAIISVNSRKEKVRVYNLTVNNDHTYYVGADQVLAHNDGVCELAQLTEKSLEHIFKGGKTGGFHHRAGGMNPGNSRVLKISNKQTSGKWAGAYNAKVEICDNGKCFTKDSTFFPDNWSKSRVQAEIQAAYLNALSNGKKTGLIVGKSSNGYPIEMFIRKGEIVTAYPKM